MVNRKNEARLDRAHIADTYTEWFRDYDGSLAADEEPQMVHLLFNLPASTDAEILDAGCGTGRFARALAAKGYRNVSAVDIIKPSGPQLVNFRQESIDKTSFDDETFDLIYCHSVIFYLEDPQTGIREFSRLLKPGGRLILTGHTRLSSHTFYRQMKRILHLPSVNHLQGVQFRAPGYYERILLNFKFDLLYRDGFRFGFNLIASYHRLKKYAARIGITLPSIPIAPYAPARSAFFGYCRANFGYHFVLVARKI